MDMVKIIFILWFISILYSCSDYDVDSLNNNNEISNYFSTEPLFNVSKLKTKNKPFKHFQNYTNNFNIHEPLGSGVAAIDVDNDNSYEVFFAQFEQNHTASVLYKFVNNEFIDITEQSGLSNLTAIMGVTTGDINNDGWQDLVVYGYNQLHIMLNNKGKFTSLVLPQMPSNSFYTGATLFDANNDDYLDLYLNRYVDTTMMNKITCKGKDGLENYCAPSALPFQKDLLLLNSMGKAYLKAPENMITIKPMPGLGVVATDFNNDGLQDIFVANDGQNNFLFTQQLDGSFVEQGEKKNISTNLSGLTEASMGIAVGDYDNNGLLDIFLTHLEQETNTLYKNEIDWFSDVTNVAKLSAKSRVLTGFGTGLYDLNGDNWLDLFMVNGRIQPIAYQPRDKLSEQFKESPLLYINQKGKFENIQINSTQDIKSVGRGLAFVDIDNDGDTDMLSNNNNQFPLLFANNLNPKFWYGIEVFCHNRYDFGARVSYSVNDSDTIFHRAIHSDGSYASASDSRILIYPDDNEEIDYVKVDFSNNQTRQVKSLLKNNSYIKVKCNSNTQIKK